MGCIIKVQIKEAEEIKMDKWFDGVFLPSLFERCGTSKSLWLTRNQTSICLDNMEKHTTLTAQFQGDYTKHVYYTYDWKGRKINLQYSKLNGCGTIAFGMTSDEKSAQTELNAKEQDRLQRERNERRMRLHPDKHAEFVIKAESVLKGAIELLEESKNNGTDKDVKADTKAVEYYTAELERITKI